MPPFEFEAERKARSRQTISWMCWRIGLGNSGEERKECQGDLGRWEETGVELASLGNRKWRQRVRRNQENIFHCFV